MDRGFINIDSDSSLFVLEEKEISVFILIYMNDILLIKFCTFKT